MSSLASKPNGEAVNVPGWPIIWLNQDHFAGTAEVWPHKIGWQMIRWGAACLVCETFLQVGIPNKQTALRVLYEHGRNCAGGFGPEDEEPGGWLEFELRERVARPTIDWGLQDP